MVGAISLIVHENAGVDEALLPGGMSSKEKGMKQLWVKVDPYKKKLVTTALETGADAVWVPAGPGPEVKALGLVTVMAPDGDLTPGRDLQEVTMLGPDEEAEVVRLARQRAGGGAHPGLDGHPAGKPGGAKSTTSSWR